jgi:acyl dehydratase
VIEKIPSRSKPGIGVIRSRTIVSNQDGVDVMSFTSIVMMQRQPLEP